MVWYGMVWHGMVWYGIAEIPLKESAKSSLLYEYLSDLSAMFDHIDYCLTKISIREKHSMSCVFSLFIVPSPFFVHQPIQGPY